MAPSAQNQPWGIISGKPVPLNGKDAASICGKNHRVAKIAYLVSGSL